MTLQCRSLAWQLVVCSVCSAGVQSAGGSAAGASAAHTRPAASRPAGELSEAKRKALEAEYGAARKRGWALHKQRRYREAAVEYAKALALAEQLYGAEHAQTARALSELAYQYAQMRQYAKAEPLFVRSLRITRASLGRDHPSVAASLNRLAWLYYQMGRYAQAEPLHLRGLAILEQKLGKDDLRVARALSNLGTLYLQMERYADAERRLRRSLAIYQAKRGKDDPDAALTLMSLATVYELTGRYARSEAAGRRALSILEAKLGSDHPEVARGLNNLAALYSQMGRYAEAVALVRRSLEIHEAKLGKRHPTVALILNNLAFLHQEMGDYATAEPMRRRSLDIMETTLGKDHPNVAAVLDGLASLYRSMGKYAEAEPWLRRSLKILETTLGKDSRGVAFSLSKLAFLLDAMGKYAEAEALYLRSLKILEAKLGPQHPKVALVLNNLAGVRQAMGKQAEAVRLLRRSLRIQEAACGADHPDVGLCLNSLAWLYYQMGRYAEAEPLFRRSLDILEAKLGWQHPRTTAAATNLAVLYLETDKAEKAWPLADRAMRVYLAERAKASRSALVRSSFFGEFGGRQLLPILALKLGKKVDVLKLLEAEQALGLRELLAQAKVRASAGLSAKDGARVRAALARLNALSAALQKHASKGHPVQALRAELGRAELKYDALMAELGKEHEYFVAAQTARAISSEQIAQSPALDDRTAIVGWVQYRKWLWGYVVRKDGTNWVNLCEDFDPHAEMAIHRDLQQRLRDPSKPKLDPRNLVKLYRNRFALLQRHLKGIRELIVVAQGQLAQLPAEMLLTGRPPPEAKDMADWPWLARKYRISYAPSVTTLDILCRRRGARKGRRWARRLFALGDPPFSPEQLAQMRSEAKLPPGQAVAAAPTAAPNASTLRALLRFDPKAVPRRLAGTRREVKTIADLLGRDGSRVLLGPEACERGLFEASRKGELRRCRYVHFATHGFADGDRPELSGLVLARVPPDKDYDGILHMREVFHLRLDADLVVLSACQTGLGKYLGGEGMVGLSTAFLFAGTPSLVMSLWNVPDAPTALLMWRFYGNLKAGRAKAAALDEAKSWLRGLTRADLAKLGRTTAALADLTRTIGKAVAHPKGQRVEDKPPDHPFAHPRCWAGFILTGDPD